MCIIVAKPVGIDFPSIDTLEECFSSNPDGAGFMYSRNKRVYIKKGFMTFNDFMEALIEADIDYSEACVMHFRIGTQGGNTPQNCHPFPVPCTEDSLKFLECETPIGMAHNGIIDLCSKAKSSVSDTMLYVQDIVTPLFRLNPSFMQNDNAIEMLENTCKSKLCFIDGLGDMVTVGSFIEDDGVLYSNTSYLASTWNYSSYKRVWDDYYVDDEKFELFEACDYCGENDDCREYGPRCTSEDDSCSYVNFCYNINAPSNETSYSVNTSHDGFSLYAR